MNLLINFADFCKEMNRLRVFILAICTIIMQASLMAVEHTVEPGQTLYSIAKLYNISVSELQKINQLEDPANLQIGMTLTINKDALSSLSSQQTIFHEVQKGETYFSISRLYSMSVTELLNINNKNEEIPLKIGEFLVVSKNSNMESLPLSDLENTIQNKSISPVVKSSTLWPNSGGTTRTVTLPHDDVKWPVKGDVSPHKGRQNGVIISTKQDTTVSSVASGTVIYLGPYRELGNIVLIEKNEGYVYIYGGLDVVFVTLGQEVKSGTSLGMLTGNNANMIFSVFKDANPIDPRNAPRD